MFRNNLVALVAYLVCIPISYLIFLIGKTFSRDFYIISITISIIFWSSYIFIGMMLKPQKSRMWNLLSVSIVSWVAVLLLLGFRLLYALFSFPQIIVLVMLKEDANISIGSIANIIFHFISMLVPMLLMWVGLEWKAKKGKVKTV